MSEQSTEERNLPPSAKKLKDARKKGKLAKSRDLVGALALVGAVIFIASRGSHIVDGFSGALLQASQLQNEDISDAVIQLSDSLFYLVLTTVLPLVLVNFMAIALGSIAISGGLVFSLNPLEPKMEHLDPVAGFKKLFGLKPLVELVKSVAKGIIVGSALSLVVLETLSSLLWIPACGLRCFSSVVSTQAKLLLGIGTGSYLVVGVFDLLLQRWLFLREMKMSASELKREYKEQEGDPLIRNAHRRHRQEASQLPRTGLKRATVLILGPGVAVGMRYVAGDGMAPTIVCRARGLHAKVMASAASELNIPSVEDPSLASALARKVPPGSFLPNQYYEPAARIVFSLLNR